MAMNENELKPCPFCGSTRTFRDYGNHHQWAFCADCGAKGPRLNQTLKPEEKEAYLAWNRRALNGKSESGFIKLLEEAKWLLVFAKASIPTQTGTIEGRWHERLEKFVSALSASSKLQMVDGEPVKEGSLEECKNCGLNESRHPSHNERYQPGQYICEHFNPKEPL